MATRNSTKTSPTSSCESSPNLGAKSPDAFTPPSSRGSPIMGLKVEAPTIEQIQGTTNFSALDASKSADGGKANATQEASQFSLDVDLFDKLGPLISIFINILSNISFRTYCEILFGLRCLFPNAFTLMLTVMVLSLVMIHFAKKLPHDIPDILHTETMVDLLEPFTELDNIYIIILARSALNKRTLQMNTKLLDLARDQIKRLQKRNRSQATEIEELKKNIPTWIDRELENYNYLETYKQMRGPNVDLETKLGRVFTTLSQIRNGTLSKIGIDNGDKPFNALAVFKTMVKIMLKGVPNQGIPIPALEMNDMLAGFTRDEAWRKIIPFSLAVGLSPAPLFRTIEDIVVGSTGMLRAQWLLDLENNPKYPELPTPNEGSQAANPGPGYDPFSVCETQVNIYETSIPHIWVTECPGTWVIDTGNALKIFIWIPERQLWYCDSDEIAITIEIDENEKVVPRFMKGNLDTDSYQMHSAPFWNQDQYGPDWAKYLMESRSEWNSAEALRMELEREREQQEQREKELRRKQELDEAFRNGRSYTYHTTGPAPTQTSTQQGNEYGGSYSYSPWNTKQGNDHGGYQSYDYQPYQSQNTQQGNGCSDYYSYSAQDTQQLDGHSSYQEANARYGSSRQSRSHRPRGRTSKPQKKTDFEKFQRGGQQAGGHSASNPWGDFDPAA